MTKQHGTNGTSPLTIADGEALGPAYRVWRRLQHGQEKITRFGRYVRIYGDKMRHQSGHDHRASVCFLFDIALILMRPYVKLDELLIYRCINHHDEPEGILMVDVPANVKTANDDLREYLVFEEMYRPLGREVWAVAQECFLLQFCLDNPPCFPEDARNVMARLATERRNEAYFFIGVQVFDYLLYAYECYAEHGIGQIMDEVADNQVKGLDNIAIQLPGFREVIWTEERRAQFTQQHLNLVDKPITAT